MIIRVIDWERQTGKTTLIINEVLGHNKPEETIIFTADYNQAAAYRQRGVEDNFMVVPFTRNDIMRLTSRKYIYVDEPNFIDIKKIKSFLDICHPDSIITFVGTNCVYRGEKKKDTVMSYVSKLARKLDKQRMAKWGLKPERAA